MIFVKKFFILILLLNLVNSCSKIEDLIIPFTAKKFSDPKEISGFDHKSDGNFSVMLMTVKNAKEVFEQQNSGKEAIKFRQTDKIKKGESLTIIIDLSGCQTNKNNECEIVGEIKVLDPKGKTYFEKSNVPLMINNGSIPQKMFRISPAYFEVFAKENDLIGQYSVTLKAKDNVANRNVTLNTNFSIIE